MFDRLRGWLLRVLRVPPEPKVPAGAGDIRVFRAAPGYYHYGVFVWILRQLGALVGLIIGIFLFPRFLAAGRLAFPGLGGPLSWFEIVGLALFIGQLPASYAILRLDFEMRWYILSDRSLRIRQGVVSLREKTMTFANIQQIAIRQNPLQRILGIADVQVRSAGGGATEGKGEGKGVGESLHEAWFRGVDDAESVSAAIRERVRLHRDTGLGDPDEATTPDRDGLTPALAAARELHAEVRELRHHLQGRGTAAS